MNFLCAIVHVSCCFVCDIFKDFAEIPLNFFPFSQHNELCAIEPLILMKINYLSLAVFLSTISSTFMEQAAFYTFRCCFLYTPSDKERDVCLAQKQRI